MEVLHRASARFHIIDASLKDLHEGVHLVHCSRNVDHSVSKIKHICPTQSVPLTPFFRDDLLCIGKRESDVSGHVGDVDVTDLSLCLLRNWTQW